MKSFQSTLSISQYETEIIEIIEKSDTPIFIDTNLIAWSFRLNGAAFEQLNVWLSKLASNHRLFIPQWVVHEYNQHLRSNPNFFKKSKDFDKTLHASLEELKELTLSLLNTQDIKKLNFDNRIKLLEALDNSKDLIDSCLEAIVAENNKQHNKLIDFWEKIIEENNLKSPFHQIVLEAEAESKVRFESRLSPGFSDKNKANNNYGDLAIWKEILHHCKISGSKSVVFITNDIKEDWVYSPSNVKLDDGKAIKYSPKICKYKLPNPDLVNEFATITGGKNLYVLSTQALFHALTSGRNPFGINDYGKIKLAVQGHLGKTDTEKVIAWFIDNPDLYKEAIKGICFWEWNPDEVNLEEFAEWTEKKLPAIKKDKVDWTQIFVDLFIF